MLRGYVRLRHSWLLHLDFAQPALGPQRRTASGATSSSISTTVARMLECDKPWRCPASTTRQPQQNNVAAGVGPIGNGIAWDVLARGCGPWLDPGRCPLFKLGNDTGSYVAV